MATIAPMRVEVNAPAPLYGGLLNVAKSLGLLHDVADPHIGLGAEWEVAPCGNPTPAPGVCDDALGIDPDDDKTFDGLGYSDAQPFALYTGLACDLFRTDYERQVTDKFDRGESFGVEQAFSTLVLKTADTDVISAGTFSVVDALGIVEDYIAEQGAGQGLIHVDRFGAARLANTRGVKPDEDFHLWTAQGTPIVNGGGYSRTGPTGQAVTGSQFWLYVTGPTHIWRGAHQYTEAPGLGVNTKFALTERPYVVGADCYVGAILVDPSLDTIGTP